MKRKALLTVLTLVTVLAVTAIAPAFTKNFNLPEGVGRIYYTGGQASIAPPPDWPFSANPASEVRFVASHIEAGSLGPGDTLLVMRAIPIAPGWVPMAYFTTNPNAVNYAKTLWNGTGAGWNTFYVPENELMVKRHGNTITVSLSVPKDCLSRMGDVFTIPAFSMELNKVGGSVHNEMTLTLTGYPNASGITLIDEIMGFNGQGAFTCAAWGYDAEPMISCDIGKHGVQTSFPP
jgi:hypothetical protein